MTGKQIRGLFVALLVLYLATVAWLCFGSFDNAPSIKPDFLGIPTDKIVHFCMFLPFPIIAWKVIPGTTKKPWHSLVLAIGLFLIGCVIAAGTELGQGLTDYRSADPKDFLADGLGLATGAVTALILDLRAAFRKNDK